MAAAVLSGCYEGFVDDFGTSTAQFARQRPLRTSVSERDEMSNIYVGVSIGGKRAVDTNDWATFEIDPSLLDGVAGKALMPANYYVLGDPATMRVRKANSPIADVKITFTDDFYNDPKSTTAWYVIPFRVTASSCDEIVEGKDYSLVCVKYVNSFSGTYYVRGSKLRVADVDGTEIDGEVAAEYYNKDISQNFTRETVTLTTNELRRGGVANVVVDEKKPAEVAKYRVRLTFTPVAGDGAGHDYNVTVGTGDSATAVEVTHIAGRFYDAPFDAMGTTNQARMELEYIYKDGADYFRVKEELIRRQDPYAALRVGKDWE
jgi:hypothetical protein